MVYLSREDCEYCGTETQHHNHECGECQARKEKERIRVWNALDVETRLTHLRERMERLERGPATC